MADRAISISPVGLYQAAGWALLVFGVVNALGFSWDIAWNRTVRPYDISPLPDVLMLSSLALSGVLCVALGLWEARRLRPFARGHADTISVDTDLDRIKVLGDARVPLGILLVAGGALTGFLSVWLDYYWHAMYGIDVALWAPFHVMGFLGGFIRDLGCLYLWGDLLRVTRGAGARLSHAGPAVAGLICTAMLLLFRLLWVLTPGLVNVPTIQYGPLQIMAYPVLLALVVPGMLIAVRRTIGNRWNASSVGGLLFGFSILVGLLVPWAIPGPATAQGWGLRPLALGILALPVLSIAALTDVLDRAWSHPEIGSPATRGALAGGALWLLGTGLASTAQGAIAVTMAKGQFSGVDFLSLPPPASSIAMALALPVALMAGAVSGLVGDALARALRRGPR